MRKGVLANTTHNVAVIVTGNTAFINRRDLSPLAVAFYAVIKHRLETHGYRVEFDKGEEYSAPSPTAAVVVGHSRGIDRLQYAAPGTRTIALQTQCPDDGESPKHYMLSAADCRALDDLPRV